MEKMQNKSLSELLQGGTEIDFDLKTGLAIKSLNQVPIYGVRCQPETGTNGWFIWGGLYSSADDFFEPVHTVHLSDLLPIVLPYLRLPPGYKFIVDQSGYEDVWFEPDDLLTKAVS
jgi:hypothetical protein